MKPRLQSRLLALFTSMLLLFAPILVSAAAVDENGNIYTGTIPVYSSSGTYLGEANVYQPPDTSTPGNVSNSYTVAYVDPNSDLGKALVASGYSVTGSGVAMESTGTATGTSWDTTNGTVTCNASIDPNCQGGTSGVDSSISVWIPQSSWDTLNPPTQCPSGTTRAADGTCQSACPAGYQLGGGGAWCEKIPEPTKVCSDGSTIPQSQACPPPPPVYKTCADGSKVLETATCPTTQTVTSTTQVCPNGSVIPLTSTCPVPVTTITCADGSTVPSTSTCPTQAPPPPPPPTTPSCPTNYSWNGSSCYYDPPCYSDPDIRSMSVAWTQTTLPNKVGLTRGTMTTTGSTSNRTATASWGETKAFQNVGGQWIVEFTPPAGVLGAHTITSTARISQGDGCGSTYGPSTFTRNVTLTVYPFNQPTENTETSPTDEDMAVVYLPLGEYLKTCLGDMEFWYCGIDAPLASLYLPELQARESWYMADVGEFKWRRLVERMDRAFQRADQAPSGLYIP